MARGVLDTVLHALVALLTLGASGAFFVPSASRLSMVGLSVSNNEEDSMILPIFPLRKNVWLPTEGKQLNLYEDRYLALSEYVIENPKYGAIYCSDKPQMVSKATDPIVPLLEPGDIGVLCRLLSSDNRMVSTAEEGYKRRLIELNAALVGRFEVESILHKGYGDEVPFILVRARRIQDMDRETRDTARCAELEESLIKELKSRQNDVDIDWIKTRRDGEGGFSQQEIDGENSHQWATDDSLELISFSFTTMMREELTNPAAQKLLRMKSTEERLEWLVAHFCKPKQPTWAWW